VAKNAAGAFVLARSSLTPKEMPARAVPVSAAAAQSKAINPVVLFIVLLVSVEPCLI
jgi:hypothetical protein